MGPSDIPLGETLPHEGAGGGGGRNISSYFSAAIRPCRPLRIDYYFSFDLK